MKITILDGRDVPHPEDNAMLQALQSRSPAPVADRLKSLQNRDVGSWMERFYIGYGHRSIGDCGTITIYIENVSMLVAKAFQDWPLYSGQEASTRYMDFSSVSFLDPCGSGGFIQEAWRDFYTNNQTACLEYLRKTYPRKENEKEATYERAIHARMFDIMRGFLPAGATTNLSWHTNLRQAADHLEELLVHPDTVIRNVAEQVWRSLKERYPHSFRLNDRPGVQEYLTQSMEHHLLAPRTWPEFSFSEPSFNEADLKFEGVLDSLKKRPKSAPLPRKLAAFAGLESRFLLDFGSYRDLQRHRNGLIRLPLLTTDFGFHSWYFQQLPKEVALKANELIANQTKAINNLPCDPYLKQNYCAMGYRVPCHVIQNLPAFIYRVELRSSKTVHPTLRSTTLKEAEAFKRYFSIPLYVDTESDSWTLRRGDQTILEKH